MEQTLARVTWWRHHHPDTRREVVPVLAFWPDEMVLLIEWRAGRSLGRYLTMQLPGAVRAGVQLERCGAMLGNWLRAFAGGDGTYGPEIESMLGLQARRHDDGRLSVDARSLLEQRVERGERAASDLKRLGARPMTDWTDRLDIDAILSSFGINEQGGFIHGDLKPDNVLISAKELTLIDWWTTPRVSWPLTDVATFLGNLRLYGPAAAANRMWRRFVQAYYPNGVDARTGQALELVATILRMTVMADQIRRRPLQRLTAWGAHGWFARQSSEVIGPVLSV
jgi:hypothetical protein